MSGVGAFEVAMTPFRGGAAVAWYDLRDGNAELYLRLVDDRGEAAGAEYRLTSDDEESYEAAIAASGDALVIAWYGKRPDESLQAYLGVWEPEQGWVWRTPIGDGRHSRNPEVAAYGDRIFCAWIEANAADSAGESVRYAFWSAAGSQLGVAQVLGAAGAETWNLNADLDANGESAFVAYDAPDSSGIYEIFIGEIAGPDAVLFQVSPSDGFASKYPDIALSSGLAEPAAALTWYDEKDGNQEAYLAVSSVAALRVLDINTRGLRVSFSDGPSIGSYLAWNEDRIGVAWSDRTTDAFDVKQQSFDRNGRPVDDIVAVTRSDADSYVPAIVPWRDGFALSWNESQRGTGAAHDFAASEILFTHIAIGAH